MQNKCPKYMCRQGPIYTGAKMRVQALKCLYNYAGLANSVAYASMKSAVWLHGCLCMMEWKLLCLELNHQCGSSD